MMMHSRVKESLSAAVVIAVILITGCSEEEPVGVEEVNPSINIFYPKEGFKVSGNSTVSVDIITNSNVDSILYRIENVEEKKIDIKQETAEFDFGDASKYEHEQEYTLIVRWWGGDGTFSDTSLFVVENDRSERITSRGNSFTLFNSVPTYTSESTRFIVQSRRTGNMEIYSIIDPLIRGLQYDEIDLDERSTQEIDLNLSNSPSSEIMPFYWAAHNQLLYSSNREGNYRLYVLDLATEGVDTLTNDDADSFFPSGSNSGSFVVYEREEDGDSDIWLFGTTAQVSSPLLERKGSDGHPSFSPDDANVVFHSNSSGTFDIWTIPAAGGEPVLAVDWDSDEKNPVWSPDSDYIAFTSNRAGNDDLWLYRLSDGSAVQLTSNSADEDFTAFHPSDPEILFSAFIDGNFDIFRLTDIYRSF